ncbi:hypothetical protein BDW72DRAFT_196314 [Aspergillus terricola var. indicus]
MKRDDAIKVPLRILPLGAWGFLSSTGNGYRKPLRDKLRFEGWEVDMVGSRDNGIMKDNDVEAHSGDLISQVHTAAKNSLAYKPNTVLINAGTNDCDFNVDPANAGERMRDLIETLINAPDMGNTLIVPSTLIPSGSDSLETNRPSVNAQFRALVPDMRDSSNISIVLAEMDPKDSESGDVTFISYTNNVHTGEQGFTKGGSFSTHNHCKPEGVRFLDVNGDELDDYVCIALDGTTYASINNGDGDSGSNKPPSFTDIGLWKSPEGRDQEHVRLADIDGDGRADYCVLADNGDVTCMGDLRGVRFEDIIGDGRDDWMWVGDDSATTTYTDSRGCIKGQAGAGLNVVWRQGFYRDADSGPTHPGLGGIFGTSGLRDQIHFARIYGEVADFGELARQDYVFLEKDTSDKNSGPTYNLHVWKSKGAGGAKIKADGNRYCNMKGHDKGLMDYVWIHSTCHMRIYPNKGLVKVPSDGSSFRGANEIIFDPTQKQIGTRLDRRDLHLADWDETDPAILFGLTLTTKIR